MTNNVDQTDHPVAMSLIIPCFNEADSLPELIERCVALTQKTDIEVILVNNGSSDNSAEVFEQLLSGQTDVRVETVQDNQGYGFGILSGLRSARGRIIGWTHADLQTDVFDALKPLEDIDGLPEDRDFLAKGLRQGRALSDTLFTFGMSVFETALLGRVLRDINAQPTIFSRSFMYSWIDEAPYDFSLDLFVYFQAKKKGIPVLRFPVRFPDRKFGSSSWNIDFGSKIKFIKRTIDYSLKMKSKHS